MLPTARGKLRVASQAALQRFAAGAVGAAVLASADLEERNGSMLQDQQEALSAPGDGAKDKGGGGEGGREGRPPPEGGAAGRRSSGGGVLGRRGSNAFEILQARSVIV
jgi:hypothetical protein